MTEPPGFSFFRAAAEERQHWASIAVNIPHVNFIFAHNYHSKPQLPAKPRLQWE
jgi:hypothetical protein